MSWLKNKTIVLTGASRGIGRALAEGLAMQGANLVLNARSKKPLKEAKERLESSFGISATVVDGDASKEKVATACVQAAAKLGEFSGVIHAAGVLNPGPLLWELSQDQYDDVVNSSCTAAWQMAKAAYPLLKAQSGSFFIAFGSGAANIAMPGIGLYCAAKAFEEHLVRQLAAEAPEVCCIAYQPGKVETRMQEQARESSGGGSGNLHKTFRAWKEQGELLTPQEAAVWLVRFLGGDFRKYHGQVVRVHQSLE